MIVMRIMIMIMIMIVTYEPFTQLNMRMRMIITWETIDSYQKQVSVLVVPSPR